MKTFIFILLLPVVSSGCLYAQEQRPGRSDIDMFSFDALNFYSPDSTRSRLDIYIEVPLNKIEFTRSREEGVGFSSKLELSIDITDRTNKTAFSKVYKEEITTEKTDMEYLSQNSKIIIKNIFLNPGDYKLKVTIYEPATKKTATAVKDVVIKDFLGAPITLSDLMIVSKLTNENGRKLITPDVTRNVSIIDTFYVFFFVYKNSEQSQINVTCNILDSKKTEVFSTSENLGINQPVDLQNQMLIPVPVDKLSYDNYMIDVTATSLQNKASISSGFSNLIVDLPVNLMKIDDLIDQLQYIATEDEMSYMRDGKTDAEKRKRFMDFWKAKDPTPKTRKNEVMMEYYKRLNYAEKHFTTVFTKGWKSDMGMVHIIFGRPDNIERHPYEMDTRPYEIWDYYDLNRQFVFIDYTGAGDYRLVTPIYERFRFQPN
ncbi:MAG: GWxTD domain-containing protein [Ignavibacteria bacterium]